MSVKLEYRLVGDYYLPNLSLPEAPNIGKYGEMRFQYLRKCTSALFGAMLMQDTLNSHLEEIDKSANEMYELLMQQYKKQFDVTERLKEESQFEWIKRMNTILSMAEEVILRDLIHS